MLLAARCQTKHQRADGGSTRSPVSTSISRNIMQRVPKLLRLLPAPSQYRLLCSASRGADVVDSFGHFETLAVTEPSTSVIQVKLEASELKRTCLAIEFRDACRDEEHVPRISPLAWTRSRHSGLPANFGRPDYASVPFV